MSGLAVESNNSLFTEAAAPEVVAAPPVQTEPEVAAPEGLEDVAIELDDDLNALVDEAFAPTDESVEPPTDTVEGATEPVDEAGMEAFGKQFEKYTGVPLKEAMTSYQQMTEAATTAQKELTTLRQQVSLQQQRLDLQVAWMSDPEIQQQAAKGVTLSEVIDQRLTQLSTVYNGLSTDKQKRIDAQGSKGIISLWQIVSKRNTRSLPGATSAPATGSSDLMTLSAIQAMPEAEFRRVGMKLLSEKQFINDLGI
jgi:hypothetical protein